METQAPLYLVSFTTIWILIAAQIITPIENQLQNVCERPWQLFYAHSADGTSLFGNKEQLMSYAITGRELKITLIQEGETFQMRVDNVIKRDREVCVESLSHLAHNGTHVDSVSPRRFYLVCTSGQVVIMQEPGVELKLQSAIYWYIKDLSGSDKPVYSHFIDGSTATGRLEHLWRIAQTLPVVAVMRDRGYAFPLHNVFLDVVTGVVSGQNVKHVGLTLGRQDNVTFSSAPYYWFSSWSTNGRRDNARWTLGKHESKGHNSDWASLDWYADTCWRMVYQHDRNGLSDYGSLEELKENIRRGHRVRVLIDRVSMIANNVRVSSAGAVAAQLLDAVVRNGSWGESIRKDTAHLWTIAHSTGSVRTYEYLVGSSLRKSLPLSKKSVSWSVDTRPWVCVLKTEDQGHVVEGSVTRLRSALEQGASIRINLQLDTMSGDFFTEPDNIRVDEVKGVVYAQAMSHVSDQKAATSAAEYELQPKAFHWYLMISSDGDVQMSAWFVGKNERLYDERAPFANITWFANF